MALSSMAMGLRCFTVAALAGDLYRSTEREEHHVDVHHESRFGILTLFEVRAEPVFVAFDAGDILVPVDLLANGLDLGKVWVVVLLIEFEGSKYVLIDNGFRAISQVPTELSEYLAWAVS